MPGQDNWLDIAKALCKEFEGLHLTPYHDPVGYPTIGYGTLLSKKAWEPLDKYPAITLETAERLLERKLLSCFISIKVLCPVPLTPNQIGVLADFTYNLGAGNLEISTLRKCINRGDHASVPKQLKRWVYAKGIKLPGLVRRRKVEGEVYSTQVDDLDTPPQY